MIDLWTSRRKKFVKCTYYSKIEDENYVPNNTLIHNMIPSGCFNAEIKGTATLSSQFERETFVMPLRTMTIETEDNVENLRENDIIICRGKTWKVDDIQWAEKTSQSQFLNKISKIYVITLKG